MTYSDEPTFRFWIRRPDGSKETEVTFHGIPHRGGKWERDGWTFAFEVDDA